MSIIKAFKGLRPVQEKAALVASPPYDVLSSAEARQVAEGNRFCFLRVVKPEIDLEPGIDPYSDAVYAKGAQNLRALEETGVMLRDSAPCLYLYEQQMQIGDRNHVQMGLVAGVSVDEYQGGLIKKHELTRADKEKDRTRHIEATRANTGPVFLTYRSAPRINALAEENSRIEPTYDFVANDGIRHRFWVVSDDEKIAALVSAFSKVPCLYIADGHHRAASASNVRELCKQAGGGQPIGDAYNYFLAVMFPHDQMYIMDYNRVVLDLNNLSESDFLARIEAHFELSRTDSPRPQRAKEFGMYLGRSWYRLRARAGSYNPSDPVESLDVAILQNSLLSPVLGISDPRTDKRIDFVGGIRGLGELERRVEKGAAVAFAMYATSIEQVLAIADAGKIMPPKSTWFEPKLRSGMVVRFLD